MPSRHDTGEDSGIAPSRITLTAAITLGTVMAAHVLLETGVDALFLANISVERLPFVTIAIALLALFASRAQLAKGHRGTLIALQTIAAGGTFGLWCLVVFSEDQDWIFYLLYVWSGLITSLIVIRFWIYLGDLFTIIEGKRLFASIAMGGTTGALLGSGCAAVIAESFRSDALLLVSSAFYLLSIVGPCIALAPSESPESNVGLDDDAPQPDLLVSLRRIFEHPYAMRVTGIVLVAGVTLTLGDYLFKSVVAAEVPPDRLAVVLSRVYLALNVLSISVLAIGVTPIVRRLGVDRSLAVLPSLIGLAAVGVLAGGALAATVLLKAADGTLRYSLHRTTSELLFLPMSSTLRSSVKGVIDIVGQAGAKAIGSLLILLLVMWPQQRMIVAAAVAISAAIWVVAALRLRRAYLDNFRATLSEGVIETAIDHPELDLDSVGSLIRALSDPDEKRALAAMRLLVEREQVSLIPSLVLYHPSANVVAFALDTFALVKRDDFLHLFDYLLQHDDSLVRAATVRASWVFERDPSRLHPLLDSDCLAVRLSAVAGLVALGEEDSTRYGHVLEEALAYDERDARLAATAAARLDYRPVVRDALIKIARDDDEEVAREAIRAIRSSGDGWFTGPLVGLLDDRRIREDVRQTLIERRSPALGMLEQALNDRETPVSVLRHIPRTIARFGSAQSAWAPSAATSSMDADAAGVLIASLSEIDSGMVRYKVLRGLEMILLGRGTSRYAKTVRRRVVVDESGLHAEFDRTLRRSLALLHFEVSLSRAQAETSDLATLGGELLVELLEDKRTLATARLFTLLGLLHPTEDFRVIQSGLESSSVGDRASAAELIETLLPVDLSRAVLGLSAPRSAKARIEIADPARAAKLLAVDDALRRLLDDHSHGLRTVALYYAKEIDFGNEPGAPTPASPANDDQDPPASPSWSLKDKATAALREIAETSPRLTGTLAPANRVK